jgi:hypothetical protein
MKHIDAILKIPFTSGPEVYKGLADDSHCSAGLLVCFTRVYKLMSHGAKYVEVFE